MDLSELFLWALAGTVLGAAFAVLAVRSRYAARLASASVERDVLRERVLDLESMLSADAEASALVAPLAASLDRVAAQVHTLERDRGEQFSRVALELARVQSSTDGLRDQTASLVGSLASANVRGSWGEVTLRRVLELSGLLARCDFQSQWTGRNEHGATVRPDVVVQLPGDKHLAIDAKVPMTDFLDAQADGLTAAERQAHLRAHARALRGHVDALAAKGYWTALSTSPELVVCFVPGEALLAAALGADPQLHEHALARSVVLASPATLFALLRTVALAWRQDSLTQGASELLALGRDLYTRIGAVGRHTETLGATLRRSVEAYNALLGSMESRVLVTARRMQELGLASADSVPAPTPIDTAPRPLTAVELIVALDEQVGRPQLVDDLPARRAGHLEAG
ncbi:MAG: DNA recombination protein RmuC [Candidatus Phosphoribacter sp.]